MHRTQEMRDARESRKLRNCSIAGTPNVEYQEPMWYETNIPNPFRHKMLVNRISSRIRAYNKHSGSVGARRMAETAGRGKPNCHDFTQS